MSAPSIDYVFRAKEKIGSGVVRILGEMERRAKSLSRQPRKSIDELIHDGRLIIKRMRALLWFVKPALGSKACTQAKTRLRKAAGLLAAHRDTAVMLATLEKLAQKAEKPRDLTAVTQILRSMARESADATPQRSSLRQTLAKSMELVCCLTGELKKSVEARAKWPAPADRLKRAFRATHQAGKRAQRTKDDADYHEWRKKAKRLLYQLELTQTESEPGKAELVKQVENLQAVLGDDHDVVVASDYFRKAAHPSSAVKRVLQLLKKRQGHLRKQAGKTASRL